MKKTTLIPQDFQAIADLFTVLADPTRLVILHLLKRKSAIVSEIVEITGLKQPNVSKHLAMLHDAGLVSRQRTGNQIRYGIGDPLVFELCALVCDKLRRQTESQAKSLSRLTG